VGCDVEDDLVEVNREPEQGQIERAEFKVKDGARPGQVDDWQGQRLGVMLPTTWPRAFVTSPVRVPTATRAPPWFAKRVMSKEPVKEPVASV
jgi:hypothetical protein